MKLRHRILSIIAAAILGMFIVGGYGLYSLRQTMLAERHDQIEKILWLARGALEHYQALEASGKLPHDEAQAKAKEALAAMQKGDDYIFVRSIDNIMLVHADASRIGKFDRGSLTPDGRYTSQVYADLLAQADQGTLTIYAPRPTDAAKQPVAKLIGASLFRPWQWVVGIGFFVDDVEKAFWRYAVGLLLISGVILVAVTVIALAMARAILRQLGGEPQYAVEIAGSIAAGDLTRVVRVDGPDDSLLAAMARMQLGLRQLVGRFNAAAMILLRASTELNGEMRKIAEGAQASAAATSSTAAAVEEMSVSIAHVNSSARETEENSRLSVALAGEGEQLAAQVVKENQQVAADVTEAAQMIRGLVSSSREIDKIAAVIKDIAGQTNLLALNAAIEAARAGETGRGFAVVADEVRKLAERTAAATQDILQTTEAVQRDTNSIAGKMDEVGRLVDHGVARTERAAGALREIHASVDGTLDQVREVAHAMSEQSEASASIAGNIERIAQMGQDSHSSIDAAREAVARLDALANDLSQAAASFRLP